MNRRCAVCDAPLPLMAHACPACGTANPARRAVLTGAAIVAVLGPAIAVAIYAATRWDQPLISPDQPAEQVLPAQPTARSDDNFAWLEAASRFRATTIGGPNFAYDLCTRAASAEATSSLDLSCLEHAYCGAEPIHPETAVRFAEQLLAHGIFAPAIRPPTVPDDTSRIRVTVTSEHTAVHIDQALAAFEQAGHTTGIL